MKTVFKTIAIAALIAGVSAAGTMSAQADPGWKTNIHSDVFKGD